MYPGFSFMAADNLWEVWIIWNKSSLQVNKIGSPATWDPPVNSNQRRDEEKSLWKRNKRSVCHQNIEHELEHGRQKMNLWIFFLLKLWSIKEARSEWLTLQRGGPGPCSHCLGWNTHHIPRYQMYQHSPLHIRLQLLSLSFLQTLSVDTKQINTSGICYSCFFFSKYYNSFHPLYKDNPLPDWLHWPKSATRPKHFHLIVGEQSANQREKFLLQAILMRLLYWAAAAPNSSLVTTVWR